VVHFLYLLFFAQVAEIRLEEPIFLVEDMTVFEETVFVLDKKSHAVAKIGENGEFVKAIQGKGAGPGEFNIPRSITASESHIFVTDFHNIHVFDQDLVFIKRFAVPNNPRDIVIWNDELYVSTCEFPGGKECLYVYSSDGVFQRKFHQHNSLDAELLMPFMDIDKQGLLYLQSAVGYGIERIDTGGVPQRLPNLSKPVRFKDFLPFGPFSKKHGMTFAAVKKWRTLWSEADGIAIVENRYLLYSFKHLEEDLLTTSYFLECFDLKESKKVVKWRTAPGKLVSGGENAYFFIDDDEPKIMVFQINTLLP